jgi:hypothetical protein
MRLHRPLNIVAPDFSRFVNLSVQFGGAIRDVNLKRSGVCHFLNTAATV